MADQDLIAEYFGIRLHIPAGIAVYACSQMHFFLDPVDGSVPEVKKTHDEPGVAPPSTAVSPEERAREHTLQ